MGFDDIQSAAFQNPSLTTVRQPLRDMGLLAARTITRRVQEQHADSGASTIQVDPELILRESVAQAPSSGRWTRKRP